MNTEIFEQLAAEVDESRLIHNLSTMISTPSVNPFDDEISDDCREQEFADLYEDQLASLGLETERRNVAPGRPNLFGRLFGKDRNKCVMLAGHMDTVGVDGYDDPFNPVVKDLSLIHI